MSSAIADIEKLGRDIAAPEALLMLDFSMRSLLYTHANALLHKDVSRCLEGPSCLENAALVICGLQLQSDLDDIERGDAESWSHLNKRSFES